MQRSLLCYLLMISALSACATMKPVMSPETQAKLTQANTILDTIALEAQQFYTEAEAARDEVRSLYGHPGWPDMKKIIEGMAANAAGEKEAMTDSQIVTATEAWNRQWQGQWQDMFSQYMALVKRCSALELERITLQSKILEAQAKCLGAAVLEYTDGRYSQGKSMEEIVEILGRSAGEPDSYTVDSMGLYP